MSLLGRVRDYLNVEFGFGTAGKDRERETRNRKKDERRANGREGSYTCKK